MSEEEGHNRNNLFYKSREGKEREREHGSAYGKELTMGMFCKNVFMMKSNCGSN